MMLLLTSILVTIEVLMEVESLKMKRENERSA